MGFIALRNGVSRANQQKPDIILDAAGLPVGFSSEFGDRTIVAMFVDTAASRTINWGDIENVIRSTGAGATTLTVPSDLILGIDNKVVDVVHTVAVYQAGTGAASFAAGAGVTLRGIPPTAAQYSTVGLMRVGANEWAYL